MKIEAIKLRKWSKFQKDKHCRISLKFKNYCVGGEGCVHMNAMPWETRSNGPGTGVTDSNCRMSVPGTELESLEEQYELLPAEPAL